LLGEGGRRRRWANKPAHKARRLRRRCCASEKHKSVKRSRTRRANGSRRMSRSVDLRRRCSAQSGQHARSRVRQQRGVLAPPGDDWHGWGCLGRGRAVVGGRTSETCGSPSAPVCRAGSVSAAEARCAQLLRGVHPPSRPRQSMIGSQSARCVGRWRWAEPVERRTHRHQLPVRSRGPECSFAGAHRPCAPATATSRNARPVSDALQR
jgi:hypothetical protein